MKPLQLFGALALATVLHGTPASSQEAVPRAVASLDAHVHTVLAGGYWWNDEAEGFFRAAVIADGVEHVDHSLYLQWVKIDPDKDAYAVAASAGVDEIRAGDGEGGLIELSHDDSEFGTLRMTVIVKRDRSNDDLKFRLSADGTLGAYTIEPIR
jgi:hypothetical protein